MIRDQNYRSENFQQKTLMYRRVTFDILRDIVIKGTYKKKIENYKVVIVKLAIILKILILEKNNKTKKLKLRKFPINNVSVL